LLIVNDKRDGPFERWLSLFIILYTERIENKTVLKLLSETAVL